VGFALLLDVCLLSPFEQLVLMLCKLCSANGKPLRTWHHTAKCAVAHSIVHSQLLAKMSVQLSGKITI